MSFPVLLLSCWLWATASEVPPPAAATADPEPLAPLPGGSARVFSLVPGGTVAALPGPGGKRVELQDGELVSFIRWAQGQDMNDAVALVMARNQKLIVPNDQVITEDRISRSPDGQWAVLVIAQSCAESCHAVGWLLGPKVRLRFSTYLDAEASIAWRPDGTEVAIDSQGLYVISLPAARVAVTFKFGSPSYSADGRLTVHSRADPEAVQEWKPDAAAPPGLAAGGPPVFDIDAAGRGTAAPRTGTASRPMVWRPGTDEGASARDGGAAQIVSAILAESTPPSLAVRIAWRNRRLSPVFAHQVARAANTRGYRLFRAGHLGQALGLFKAAAALDPRYVLPRASAAKIYALSGVSPGRRALGERRPSPGARRRFADPRRRRPLLRI
jgi:hypothetical protein